MLKTVIINTLLASVLVQQVIGSHFVVVTVNKIAVNNNRLVSLDEFIQVNNGYNTALKSDCDFGVGATTLPIFDMKPSLANFFCEKSSNSYYFKGTGNYLTALGTGYYDMNDDIPCIRVDDSYKFTTYVCSSGINRDLIEVPTPDPSINKPSPIPTPDSSINISSPTPKSTTTTTTLKSSSTPVPTCTKGYCGLKAGTGKTGACCSSSDDCLDTCNSNGKCGVSDMTGEPKSGCP
ncbi:hypothetical protein BJ944DRAFT_271554, partial [Cunninghamella echinulata]